MLIVWYIYRLFQRFHQTKVSAAPQLNVINVILVPQPSSGTYSQSFICLRTVDKLMGVFFRINKYSFYVIAELFSF